MSRYKPSLKYGASDKQKFVVYEKVFARMKGYPPWPAKIMPQKLEQKNVSMFSHCIVYFYGTKQLGECSFVDIYEYESNKIRFQDVCQSSKSTKNAFEMALNEIAEDDGERDDMSVDFVTEEIEFDAPICQLLASKQAKKMGGVGKKRKQGGGRGGGGAESQDEGVHTEEEEGGGRETGRAKRGYDSQDDNEDYDSIPEDENTADDDDDNDVQEKTFCVYVAL
uniref:PWWP domain-containing protein n=1 Tax=Cacopsylla melanoneura TaxID=428564 RepID=A0A8D8MAJ7_9HEMI